MKNRVRELREIGDGLFSKRTPLVSQWQEIALNFYPERADFITQRSLGTEFASHLVTGEPALARREMANTISSMLRPRGQTWFHARTNNERIDKDPACKAWLEWMSDIMRRFMYEDRARFIRTTKEADNDFVTFGQTVIQLRENLDRDGLLFLNHHLRDTAWTENAELAIDQVHRNWQALPRQLCQLFPKRVDPKVKEARIKKPNDEIRSRHIVLPRDQYESPSTEGYTGQRLPFVSIYIDLDNETILEEVGQHKLDYIIPRWQTVSGSQYAHSPATVIALADARMLQQISLTLIEAGQKAVDPPLLAKAENIQGGVNTYPGGITWFDADYDERLGEVLRPMMVEKGGFQWGDALQQRISTLIKEAFYLNQLQMPEITGQMTAYEVQKRFEEYMRRALPLFEPMETEYNAALCNESFDLLIRKKGAFGDLRDMPGPLKGQEIKFAFESPIQAAQARQNVQAFMQAAEILKIAAELDPSITRAVKLNPAVRDAMDGAGVPAAWMATDQELAQQQQQAAQEAELAKGAAMAGAGVDLAGKAGDAMGSIRDALAPRQGEDHGPPPADLGGVAGGGGQGVEQQLAALLSGQHSFTRDGNGNINGVQVGGR